MKAFLFSAMVLATLSCISSMAAAQSVGIAGTPTSPGAKLLRISATKPIPGKLHQSWERPPIYSNGFRVVFRIFGTEQKEVPMVVIGHGGLRSDYVFSWSSVTSRGASCEMDVKNLKGVEAFSGGTIGAEQSIRDLASVGSAQSTVSPTRPTMVVADFKCDGPIEVGDTVIVQLKFFVLNGYRWVPADFTFVDMPVSRN